MWHYIHTHYIKDKTFSLSFPHPGLPLQLLIVIIYIAAFTKHLICFCLPQIFPSTPKLLFVSLSLSYFIFWEWSYVNWSRFFASTVTYLVIPDCGTLGQCLSGRLFSGALGQLPQVTLEASSPRRHSRDLSPDPHCPVLGPTEMNMPALAGSYFPIYY